MTVKPCYAENAAIVEDDGRIVKFHPICPKCGKVMRNVTGSGYCADHNNTLVGYFMCENINCHSFPVTLHRG